MQPNLPRGGYQASLRGSGLESVMEPDAQGALGQFGGFGAQGALGQGRAMNYGQGGFLDETYAAGLGAEEDWSAANRRVGGVPGVGAAASASAAAAYAGAQAAGGYAPYLSAQAQGGFGGGFPSSKPPTFPPPQPPTAIVGGAAAAASAVAQDYGFGGEDTDFPALGGRQAYGLGAGAMGSGAAPAAAPAAASSAAAAPSSGSEKGSSSAGRGLPGSLVHAQPPPPPSQAPHVPPAQAPMPQAPQGPPPLAPPLMTPPANPVSARELTEEERKKEEMLYLTTQEATQIAKEQYGLLGILKVIRMTDPDLNMLALGMDLTTLGLNLNSAENLHGTFASPWSDTPLKKEKENDFYMPPCYYQSPPQLKTAHLQKFSVETLFYIFFNMPRDILQAYAAAELYNRQYRYHRDVKAWLNVQDDHGHQRWMMFDPNTWEKKFYDEPFDQNGFLTEDDVRVKILPFGGPTHGTPPFQGPPQG